MTQYTLHKISEGFIITSNEKPKDGELVLPDSKIITPYREMYKGDEPLKCWLKVIAQQEQIDFSALSEEDCKKIGYFHYFKIISENKHLEKLGWEKGFYDGVQEARQFLADRMFKQNDLIFMYNQGVSATRQSVDSYDNCLSHIQSLSQKSWSIEIEMEQENLGSVFNGIGSNIMWGEVKPKLTNNKIKILKLL